jgi:hypothetical protein
MSWYKSVTNGVWYWAIPSVPSENTNRVTRWLNHNRLVMRDRWLAHVQASGGTPTWDYAEWSEYLHEYCVPIHQVLLWQMAEAIMFARDVYRWIRREWYLGVMVR